MKKSLPVTLVILLLSITTYAQKIINGCIIKLSESSNQTLSFHNDSLDVYFQPSEYFWYIQVKNKLKGDISLVWAKSNFIVDKKASSIIFDNTALINKDNIPDELIPSESFIERNIYPSENLESGTPTISKRLISKKYKEESAATDIKIKLAVDYNGKMVYQDFNFKLTPKL